MKAQYFLLLAIIIVLFTACKNDKDYRDKWVGGYVGEYTSSIGTMNGTITDTINNFKVSVSLWQDSCILIKFDVLNMEWTPIVNLEGEFEQYGYPYGNPECIGNIRNNSLNILRKSQSPGHSGRYEFKGKKQ